MNEYIYIGQSGDKETILKYVEQFKTKDDSELLEACENQRKRGIVGVHQQALYFIALQIVMKERFNDSIIIIEDNCLIKFKEDETGVDLTPEES